MKATFTFTLLLLAASLSVPLHAEPSEAIVAQCALQAADKNSKFDVAEYRKITRMGGHAEQHFKSADLDKEGLLNLAEFTSHSKAKLKNKL